ncbi:hypothetical protein ACFWXA_03975 [Streptomyces atroolivaceus]|uniref:hypothetical protein n=1 Tax=Streptomyces atroolivaceus TaxID=66869 RepID=UPI0036614A8D
MSGVDPRLARQDGDPFISFPLRAPESVPGCPECGRLVCAEKLADEQADPSRATDERVRLRAHLEADHGVPRPQTGALTGDDPERSHARGERGKGGTPDASRPT